MLLSEKNKHPYDSRVKLVKEGHKYYIDGDCKDIISISEFYKQFFPKFDSEKTVEKILLCNKYKNDPSYKYYKMDKESILSLWNNNKSSEEGTKLHDDIEKFLNEEKYENTSVEFEYFLKFYEEHKDIWETYRTEFIIFSKELKVAGSIDVLFKNKHGNYIIGDWKRSKDIKQSNIYEKGLFPLEKLDNCNYIHYSLQLNLYKKILESFYDIKISELYLIILHPNNKNYEKIKIPELTDEVELLFLMRIKELKDKGYSNDLFDNMTFLEHNRKKLDEKLSIEMLDNYRFKSEKIEEKLSEKQQLVYNLLKKGRNIFMSGAGGVGKSHLIKKYYNEYEKRLNIGITSMTGVSAVLIGGTTLHSFFGIGLGKEEVSSLYLKIKRNSYIYKRWKELDVLVIDEISMLSPVLFDKLENLARVLRSNEEPFGGIQLILSGDLLQLPVVEDSNSFCFESESWKKCIPKENIICLTENFRQDDEIFRKILNEGRFGILSDESLEILRSRENVVLSNKYGILPTKIFSLNKDVDYENEKQLNNLALNDENLEFMEYELTYDVIKKNCKIDFEEKIKKNCIVPFVVQLCKGAQVMLLYNLDVSLGLCNGSRGVIVGFDNDIPIVNFLNGRTEFINHVTWTIEENSVPILSYTQIPLKVAYAVSIHKCQGTTIDYAEVDFANIFEYGQAYVALSRCRRLDGLIVKNISKEYFKAHPKIINFYKELNDS